MFGYPPHKYLGIEEEWMGLAIDFACACGHWEDENQKYAESKDAAERESLQIGEALEQARQEAEDR